jgi:hypothetical protein
VVRRRHDLVAAGRGSQAAEHQHVVPRGVVELARQLLVEQVGDMQVHQGPAFPAVQGVLEGVEQRFELGTRAADPQEAAVRQRLGGLREFDETIGADVEDAQRGRAHRQRRNRRAASSAK